jgi:hypothetical protein
MIFLGLIVAVVAVGVGVAVVLDNSDATQLTLFGETIPGITSQWQIFAAGAAVAVVFMSGMVVAVLGVGRAIRVRRELRDLRDSHEESLTTLEMEKRHLQRELARARREHPIVPDPRPDIPVAPGPRPGTPTGPAVSSSPFFDSPSS